MVPAVGMLTDRVPVNERLTLTITTITRGQRPLITGGAWGSLLRARGLSFGSCPDACNIAYPEVVAEIAGAYAEAGSDIVLTNTFQANRVALRRCGLDTRVGEINRTGVAMTRRSVNHCARVFASIGPTGAKRGEIGE